MDKTSNVRNYLKAVRFEGPDWIPCTVGLLPATWIKHREKLEDIVLRHPRLFPGYEKGSRDFDAVDDKRYQAGEFTDNWGCRWRNIAHGLDAAPAGGPLEDWDALDGYTPPDPIIEGDGWTEPPDWDAVEREFADAKARGSLATGCLPHGFMYMRLWYLRGFENLMVDFATDEPMLERLIALVLDHNMKLVRRTLDAGAERMIFGDDLGLQASLPIAPETFHRYLTPCYAAMFAPCREHDALVYLHTDGHILEIIPDLIEAGVDVVNPQIRANTLEGLQRCAKGRVCIHLDLDRQLFPFATPNELRRHIHEAVDALSTPQGGLMLSAECAPDVPLPNVETICRTLEEVGGPAVT
jgi:uroporphyrinogen decarboxylase